MESENIPGLSISVSYNDTIIFSEGFGFSDLENKIPVLPEKTKFNIGSITKTITAATLGKLAEAGNINMDKSIYFYLDSLPKKKYDFTIKQIAGHLSGLARNPKDYRFDDAIVYDPKFFYGAFAKEELLFRPSTRAEYSNFGFHLLGLLIEKQSGKELTQVQKEFVLDKLKMQNTSPDYNTDANEAKLYPAKKENNSSIKDINWQFQFAEGGYISTTEDLIKLGNAFLFPGRLLKKETLIEFISSQKLLNDSKSDYGIGFVCKKDVNRNFFFGHEGNSIGSRSWLYVYPNSKLVITVLANKRMGKNSQSILPEIAYNYIELLKNIR